MLDWDLPKNILPFPLNFNCLMRINKGNQFFQRIRREYYPSKLQLLFSFLIIRLLIDLGWNY